MEGLFVFVVWICSYFKSRVRFQILKASRLLQHAFVSLMKKRHKIFLWVFVLLSSIALGEK